MPVTRRDFIRGGVAALPSASPRRRSSATSPAHGSEISQSRGGVSRRWQRCAEHRGAVSRSVLLQPPTDDCSACRAGGGSGPTAVVARSGCTRGSVGCRASSTRAARPSSSARGIELEPVAFPGIRHLGFSQSVEPVFHGLAGPVSRNCSEGCAVRMGDDARGATGLLSRSERAGHSGRAHMRFCQPEQRCRSTERTGGSYSGSRRTCRSTGRSSRS